MIANFPESVDDGEVLQRNRRIRDAHQHAAIHGDLQRRWSTEQHELG